MAATGKVIGTVTAVVGEAKATAADGTVRILQVGDKVHSDEVITTSAAGSINVALENGKTLDCGADADLALHEGLLNVAMAPAVSAPASDVEAIQRAIAAGQDPSQVAAATAAGAPAAGGTDDGGSHDPVVLEQSNEASVVNSGFLTEGDTITFAPAQVESMPGAVVATAEIPDSGVADQPATPAIDTPEIVVSDSNPGGEEPAPEANPPANNPVIVADSGSNEQPQPPVVVTQPSEPSNDEPSSSVGDPVIVVTQPETDDTPAEEPVVVVTEPETDDTPAEEPVVVVTEPETDDTPAEEPVVVVTEPETDDTPAEEPVVVVTEPETTSPESVSIAYTISANTNQDEQIGRLLFQNGDNEFQALVFFGQEGQQKPTSLTLNFELTDDTSTVKLEYIDAFAGNSDDSTGHTAQKIAIKDFGLTIDGVPTVLAQENDGVNVGVGSNSLESEGTVQVDMGTGEASDWTFANPDQANGIDILDLTGTSLDVSDVTAGTEVINLQGSLAQEMTLNAEDVLNMAGSDALHIVGGKEDTLNLADEGWTVADGDAGAAGVQPSYFGWVQVTHDSGATLLVDPDVNIKTTMMG
jgi:hypothetical protein